MYELDFYYCLSTVRQRVERFLKKKSKQNPINIYQESNTCSWHEKQMIVCEGDTISFGFYF